MSNISETNIYLENIYDSIKSELQKLELELKSQLYSVTKSKIDLFNVINYFFEIPGKKLRPILTILSAGTVAPQHPIKKNVIELAAALELIHNSSLIHDDIVDESQNRRGRLTMNHRFNNKIAVLAGDLLYTHAFLIVNKIDNPQVSGIIAECVERMCKSEIKEIISPVSNYDEYISYLDNKTANLMSICCRCGAILSEADQETANALGDFGRNFG
ncbi:MAG: polyprenyl synthetase family protein, partial [Candidatus Cloacimonetes bacterium]|nr:polyprenyl synthetase family protein [Candidatus Cloacimonadota bacterium]